VYVRAGEPQGLTLAHEAITKVSALQSVAIRRERLVPLATALQTRPGTDTRELARTARQATIRISYPVSRTEAPAPSRAHAPHEGASTTEPPSGPVPFSEGLFSDARPPRGPALTLVRDRSVRAGDVLISDVELVFD
jgi:hypothetical protein